MKGGATGSSAMAEPRYSMSVMTENNGVSKRKCYSYKCHVLMFIFTCHRSGT